MLESNIVVIGGEKRPSNTLETFDPKVSYLAQPDTGDSVDENTGMVSGLGLGAFPFHFLDDL